MGGCAVLLPPPSCSNDCRMHCLCMIVVLTSGQEQMGECEMLLT